VPGTVIAVIACATSTLVGAVAGPPAPPRYCQEPLQAVSHESQTEGFRDVAGFEMACFDKWTPELDFDVEFYWWQSAYLGGPMYDVPGCPTSATGKAVSSAPFVGALVWTAECTQPAGSAGSGQVRTICAHLTLNGEDYNGYSPFDNGFCVQPTAV
jgi:hypothetical protein